MHRRVPPALLLKTLAAVLALALLAALAWPALRVAGDGPWLLLAVVLVAVLAAAGFVLRRFLGRGRGVELTAWELTPLTFPPERRRRRLQQD